MIQKAKPRWNQRVSPFKAYKGVSRTVSPNEGQYQSKRWKTESKQFRKGRKCRNPSNNPRCKGTADTVDHIRNIALTSADFWDQSNWMVLCRSCHAIKSNQERVKHKNNGSKEN